MSLFDAIKESLSGNSQKVNGLIASYKLTDWWLSTFSDSERRYIDSKYHPMGAPAHTLTKGHYSASTLSVIDFLNGLSTWFRKKEDSSIRLKIQQKMAQIGRVAPDAGPGTYQGRHYTTYVEEVKDLKRQGDLDAAERLLAELVKATEAEAKAGREKWRAVAPWYYEQMAIVYRKRKDYKAEAKILERYFKQKKRVQRPDMDARLVKARALLESVSTE